MRPILTALSLLLCAAAARAQFTPTTNRPSARTNLPGVTSVIRQGENRVVTDSTGLIIWPTNFWRANSNSLRTTVGEIAGSEFTGQDLLGSGINLTRYDAAGQVGVAFVGESGATNLLIPYDEGVPPRFPYGLVGALDATNLTGTLDEARIPSTIARNPSTNYVWLSPYDGRDYSLHALVTTTSNYYGATLLATTCLGPYYDYTPAYFTTVSAGGNRFQRWPIMWLPGYQHFRVTGYWCSTNSDNNILLWRRMNTFQGGAVAQQVDVSAAFNYSSTTTNLVEDVAVFDFDSPTLGPVNLEYGLKASHDLNVTLWLLALKLEYW